MSKKSQKKIVQNIPSTVSTYTESRFLYPWWYYALAAIVLGVITFCVYWPTRNYEFQFDDLANITKRYNIRHLTFWSQFFHGRRWISYWLNSWYYSIAQFDPLPYRLGNICVHIATGLLVFFVLLLALSRLKKQSFFKDHAFSIALMTAVLFLLHPVQTQTVSYVIQGQQEGTTMLFFMLTTLLFLCIAAARNSMDRIALYVLYFASAAITCGTKEISIILPMLILLFDWFFVAQGSWKDLRTRWWVHLCTFCIVMGVQLYFLKPTFFVDIFGMNLQVHNNIGNVITDKPLDLITPYSFFISQFKVIIHYLWMFIWPFNISVEYDWVLSKSFFALDCLLPFALLTCLAACVWFILKRDKASPLAFGFLWFFACIGPRSSFIPSSELLVDYKTYSASLGWLLVLALYLIWCAHWVHQFIKKQNKEFVIRPAQIAGTALLIGGLSFATIQRNTIWQSGLNFWGSMLVTAPGKARIYNNYGFELSQKYRRYDESVPYFKKAIEMDNLYPDPHNNLAVVYGILGNIDAAIDELKAVIRIHPYHAEAYNNLSAFLLSKGDYQNALISVGNALRIKPAYGKAFINKGRAYLALNQQDLALESFRNACTKADCDNELGFSAYGQVAFNNKKYDEAIFAFSHLVAICPQHPQGYFQLGNAYLSKEDYTHAIESYKMAYQINQNPQALFNLSEAYRRTSQFALAIDCLEKLKPEIPQLPHIAVKLAECYRQIGKTDQAKQVLEQLIGLPVPDAIKAGARVAIAQLNTPKATDNKHVPAAA